MAAVVLVDRDGVEHTVTTVGAFQHAVFRNGMRPDTMSIAEAAVTVAGGQALPAQLQRLLEEFPETSGGDGTGGSVPVTDTQKEVYVPSRLSADTLAGAFVAGEVRDAQGVRVPTKRLHVVLTADGTDIDDLIIEDA